MPALQSQGFQLGVMPQLGQIDPRLFNTSGQLIGGFQSGLGAYGALQNISDEAVARPVRNRLRDIQLANAESALALAPLEDQRRRITLAQPIERVIAGGLEEVPRYELQPMFDEEGVAVLDRNGQQRMERPAGADVFATETIEVIDPATGRKQTVTRRTKPTQTLEQAALAADQADYRDQIAAIRLQQAATQSEAATAKAENDRIKADAIAARAEAALNDPKWRTVSSGVDATGNLVINQVNSDGELRAVSTGQKPRANNSFFGSFNLGGGLPATGAAPANIDPAISALVNQIGGNRPASVPIAPTPARTFNTVQEAEAAAAAGILRPGDKITVGGRAATWH